MDSPDGNHHMVVNAKVQTIAEQKVETERLVKKINLQRKFEFKKSNKVQHGFNASVTATMEEATGSIEKGRICRPVKVRASN